MIKQLKRNYKTVKIWNVRPAYAKIMHLNFQKESFAGEAPHLEHHRTRWKNMKKQCTSCGTVKSSQILCYKDVSQCPERISWWSSTLRTSQSTLKRQWKSNEKAVEMWKVRPIYAIMRYRNLQQELWARETPHLEHHRTRWQNNGREMNKLQKCEKCANFVL